MNLSIRDGWWDEWYDGENGWEIPSADGLTDEARRDDLEASALYDLLEHAVAPKFYERDEHGVPPRWIEMVRHTLQTLGPKVLASRMVRDYVEQYYAPAAQSLRKTVDRYGRRRSEFGAARELADYRRRAEEAWPKIVVTDVDSTGLPDTPVLGSKLTLTATVQLAGLAPDEVTVQAVLGRVDSGDALLDPVTVEMSYTGTADGGNQVFSTTTPLPLAGAVGYTVRVLPQPSDAGRRQRARPGHPRRVVDVRLKPVRPARSRSSAAADLRGVGGLPERRQRGAQVTAVAGGDHPRVQHRDHSAVGDAAQQPARTLRQQQRRMAGGDGHEAVAAAGGHRALAGAQQRVVRAAETGCGRSAPTTATAPARRRPATATACRTARSPRRR